MGASRNGDVLHVEDAHKELAMGEVRVQALRGVSLRVERGEFVAIMGPSGSGKSTLLGLIGGLDTPTSGTIRIDGTDITSLGERALTRIRNEKIGFVFQSFNLIPTLTAAENVALPAQFASRRVANPARRAGELLAMFGVGDRLDHRPTQLSGGQQQRVAIARALANDPALLLADEPTGNLDTASAGTVMGALGDARSKLGMTLVVVTHSPKVAATADRIVELVDGRIARDTSRHAAGVAE